ncbi:MAG: hypothetical protein ABL949_02475 [Fimbriimonadaceae bacterium]
MKKIFTLILVVCAFGVVLGGCSGGDAAKTDEAPKTETKTEEGK